MADLLDPGALPKGVALDITKAIDGEDVVHLSLELGRLMTGPDIGGFAGGPLDDRAHIVMKRRAALALGLQISRLAMLLAPEDRG